MRNRGRERDENGINLPSAFTVASKIIDAITADATMTARRGDTVVVIDFAMIATKSR